MVKNSFKTFLISRVRQALIILLYFTLRYGKLVGLHVGPYLAVCVYDYEIAKEMLAKEEASGRPNIFWNNIRMLDKRLGKF